MKNFKIEDVPDEVLRCWQLQSLPFVGMGTMEEINRIVEKYPEWFEWEHKYAAIPKEVHEAFNKELYPPVKMPEFNDKDAGKGILERLKDNTPTTVSITASDVNQFFNLMESQRIERQEFERRKYKLFKKHYGKYGLEWRENKF